MRRIGARKDDMTDLEKFLSECERACEDVSGKTWARNFEHCTVRLIRTVDDLCKLIEADL